MVRYIWLVPVLVVLSQIPGYTLRIHHWFYPMLAIPVLSLPNRVSIFGQAIMLGLFLDGIGRWGWAGIIQQTASVSLSLYRSIPLLTGSSSVTPIPEATSPTSALQIRP